ncbi:MAG: hypothetical protein JWP22_2269, partial [Ramlibacter sp.]|nr:hypothetical protein [Ramlibacter sp.]
KYSKFASAGEKADLRQNTPTLVDPGMAPGARVAPAARIEEGPAQEG